MKQDTVKVVWTPVTDSGSSTSHSSSETITGVMRVDLTLRTGKTADTFSMKLFDVVSGENDYYYSRMKTGDVIKVYSSEDGGATFTLELEGVVRQTKKTLGTGACTTVVTGLNRLEYLFGVVTPITGGVGAAKTADEWIRLIIREVNTQNGFATYSSVQNGEPTAVTIHKSERYIYGGLLSEWIAAGNDQTTKSFNNGFSSGDMNAFELISDLSSEEWAGDTHIFYMDTSNHFIWKKLHSDTTDTISDEHRSSIYETKEYDSYNYVIVKAGKNLYGNANINTFKYDNESATLNGFKTKVEFLEGIGARVLEELKQKLKNEGYYSEDTFPFSTTYPVKTPSSWTNPTTVNSDAELNSEFVDEVVLRAERIAQRILELKTSASLKAKRELTNDESIGDYGLGDYLSDSYTGNDLRVVGMTKSYDAKKGWDIYLHLEEDVERV